MHKFEVEVSEERLEQINLLMEALAVPTFSELVDYLVEDQIYQLGSPTIKAENIRQDMKATLNEVLDPHIGVGEVRLSKSPNVSSILTVQTHNFEGLIKSRPKDKVLRDNQDSEIGRKACEMVYLQLDVSQWGSDIAKQLVERTIQLIDKGNNFGQNEIVG